MHKIAGRQRKRKRERDGGDRMEVRKGSEGEGKECVICNPILS